MSMATEYTKLYTDIVELMIALDRANVDSDHDWEREITTWVLEDGSQIVSIGNEVIVKQPSR